MMLNPFYKFNSSLKMYTKKNNLKKTKKKQFLSFTDNPVTGNILIFVFWMKRVKHRRIQ